MEQCFYVKTSLSAKNKLHPAKMKIDPKSDNNLYTLFAERPSIGKDYCFVKWDLT